MRLTFADDPDRSRPRDGRRRVALVFGGRSAEHEVSILSARSVAEATNAERIAILPAYMRRDGRFAAEDVSRAMLEGDRVEVDGEPLVFESWLRESSVDIVFPIVHGTGGEDGSLQGYLETVGIPYVGSGVTASAIGMDKHHMKQAFAAAKLPIVEYVAVTDSEWAVERERVTRAVMNTMRLPYFVKPANGGSSVGVTKVRRDGELAGAVEHALGFDAKVLVERGVDAREIEVAILGNESPQASVAGEIITGRDFYDYQDKYIDDRSQLVIPAKLPKERAEEIRRSALGAFRAIGASGFARVDFFIERGTNRFFVNEINTLPGFTAISMYPKLWEATEIKYPRLIERLIELGLERGAARRAKRDSAMQWLESAKRLS